MLKSPDFGTGMQMMLEMLNMLCCLIKFARYLPLESDAITICRPMSEKLAATNPQYFLLIMS